MLVGTVFLGVAGLDAERQVPAGDRPVRYRRSWYARRRWREKWSAEVELKPSLPSASPGRMTSGWRTATSPFAGSRTGPIRTVRLFYYGDLTRLGGHDRGNFATVIADQLPNTGEYKWVVPWIDSSGFVRPHRRL